MASLRGPIWSAKHAQQAVERALKTVLAGVHYPFTHDIDRLVELVEAEGVELSESLREAGQLTPWALAHRYESAPTLGVRRQDMLAPGHGGGVLGAKPG